MDQLARAEGDKHRGEPPIHDASIERLLSTLNDIEEAARGNAGLSRNCNDAPANSASNFKQEEAWSSWSKPKTPRMVELIPTNKATLETAGAEFRAAQALATRLVSVFVDADFYGLLLSRGFSPANVPAPSSVVASAGPSCPCSSV